MCLLAFAWNAHDEYPLVFAGNRDEFHRRPTAAAAWWIDAPDVIGGRDLEAGGSWLGISREGRIAVVTNQPGLESAAQPGTSRGDLVTRFLAGDSGVGTYMDGLEPQATRYAGFGLVAGDIGQLEYLGHEGQIGKVTRATQDHGCFALSNASRGTHWPKIAYLEAGLAELLEQDRINENDLFELLAAREPRVPGPFDDQLAKMRATPFVLGEQYGTRASTVIIVDRQRVCRFTERRFDATGKVTGETHESFRLRRDD